MIQDIEPQRFNNQYSNRREPEDHDMVLSFSEKMIFAKVMDDENLLGFMTYGELQKITGCDRKIEDLVYLFSIDDTAYFLWNGDNRLTAPGYDYRSMYKDKGLPSEDCGSCGGYQLASVTVVQDQQVLWCLWRENCS